MFGESTGVQIWETVKDRSAGAGRRRKRGGKVREEKRAFRRRIIRILLFEDEN